ncbi:MAG: NADH-quinone oxidoreductase subunit NuoN [Planctomycetes bacterium]|nr:NADH-quinone oxidoreductase subunit NuoN [Planctomycetota bacterium]
MIEMSMATKISTLWPEIVVTAVAFAVMIIGLSPTEAVRRATYPISALGLLIAAIMAATASPAATSSMAVFMKVSICLVGLALLVGAAETPDEANASLPGAKFNPADASRGEFFGFLLLSLVGAMLCAGADDLVWLFLALELTSLPTYVLVATSRRNLKAPEAAVKYFFLGAMSAAIFLYGFALIYGATGTTYLNQIHVIFAEDGISTIGLAGLIIAVIGVCFKIAAVPMHTYVADVYQGAATPVTAFLAFVPKAAGFLTLILLLDAVGWIGAHDTAALGALFWVLAVLTMFVGNTLALLQSNVKRVLAYSSIAHSGYMLIGLVAGPGTDVGTSPARNGVAAVLFYMVAYGVMNLGAFAVLGLLKRSGEEAESFDDLRGLARRRPLHAAIMALCVLSLAGIPPLVGFWGKLYIFGAAISAGYIWLAVLGLLNSAIGAFYYLRIIATCYLTDPDEAVSIEALPSRSLAAVASAIGVIVLSLAAGGLVEASHHAADAFQYRPHVHTPVQAKPVAPAAAQPVAELPR